MLVFLLQHARHLRGNRLTATSLIIKMNAVMASTSDSGGVAMASDFGSSVSVYRADGHPPLELDETRIVEAARGLQSPGVDRVSPFADLELVIGSCHDGIEGVELRLTSYFLEDEDHAAEEDAIIARDEIVAQQFAQQLEQVLGDAYRIEYYSGRW